LMCVWGLKSLDFIIEKITYRKHSVSKQAERYCIIFS
jgi:hypothetical protein